MLDLNESVEWNKQKAYSGKLGRSRELFCHEYMKQKGGMIEEVEKKQLQEVESNHATMTCKKQCKFSSCCMEYIEATIQECDTIVYYLYNHKEALSRFLKNYPEWRERVSSSGDIYKEFDKIYGAFLAPQAKQLNPSALEELDQKYFDFHIQYFDLHIPCPFLHDNECIIYDVRPFNCVCSYSTSPVELCALINNKIFPPINRSLPPENALNSSFYYGELQTPRVLFMPLNVYEIIVRGYAHIADVTGLTEMGKEAERLHLIRDVGTS